MFGREYEDDGVLYKKTRGNEGKSLVYGRVYRLAAIEEFLLVWCFLNKG